jgi:hypothetical protein
MGCGDALFKMRSNNPEDTIAAMTGGAAGLHNGGHYSLDERAGQTLVVCHFANYLTHKCARYLALQREPVADIL